ncbi:hypothetical protein Tco_0322640 [Tanacetum coccineum]
MLVWILGPKSVERASVLHQPDGVESQRHHIVPIGDLNGVSIAHVARSHMVEEDKAPPEVDMGLVDKHLHLAGMRMVDKYMKLAYMSKEMMQNKLRLRLVDIELLKLVVVHST